jgi:hypothetical protein
MIILIQRPEYIHIRFLTSHGSALLHLKLSQLP